jgi:hypothetical protein
MAVTEHAVMLAHTSIHSEMDSGFHQNDGHVIAAH